jgi:GAF domain-containing protein
MTNNQTIIIVDDLAADRELYHRYLQKENRYTYTIIEAESGEEALEKYQLSQPDLILLDYQLPDFDGLEFIAELKTQNSIISPIIMLTGQGDERIAVKAMKSGVKDYLIKGNLTENILRNSVHAVLQQYYLQNLLLKNRQQQQLIAEIALRIRQSLDLTDILDNAVEEVQRLLNCDRVVIYRFNSDMIGNIVAESVKLNWKKSLGLQIVDTCFQTEGAAKYQQGHLLAISNVYEANLSPCYLKLLEQFQVKANLTVPILLNKSPYLKGSSGEASSPGADSGGNFQGSKASPVQKPRPFPPSLYPQLWGLLIAHQCSDSRIWQEDEIELLNKLVVQIAIAVQQAELIDNLQSELDKREQAENSLRERKKELEWVNQELIKISKLLKQRNQELDEFAYIASDDLKAPLRAISNLATWLSEDLAEQIPEENQHQLGLLQSRVRRMDGFIQGLLTYSRIGRNSYQSNYCLQVQNKPRKNIFSR